jgi:serine/threonine protein phosphatase PrpC
VRVDYAKLSLAGNRTENQDRVDVITHTDAVLMVVVDGMGGHAVPERLKSQLARCASVSPK